MTVTLRDSEQKEDSFGHSEHSGLYRITGKDTQGYNKG